MQNAKPKAKSLAHVFRRRPTKTESVLWRWLRGRRFGGVKFRRQHPIGRYVLDFYSDELKLAVELDGAWHGGAHDRRRTAWLNGQGIAVIRFRNHEIRDDPASVAELLRARIESIVSTVTSPAASRLPSPAGRGR